MATAKTKRFLLMLLFFLALTAGIVKVQKAIGLADKTSFPRIFSRACEDWAKGDYLKALEGFEKIISSPGFENYFDRIALITGELFETREISSDGRNPRFSADGSFLLFESGARGQEKIYVLRLAQNYEKAVELNGTGPVFSPSQREMAYLRVKDNEELKKIRQSIEKLLRSPELSRVELMNLERERNLKEAEIAEVVVRNLETNSEISWSGEGFLKGEISFSADGQEIYFVGTTEAEPESSQIFALSIDRKGGAQVRSLTTGKGFRTGMTVVPGGRYLIFNNSFQNPFPRPAVRRPGESQPPGMGSAQVAEAGEPGAARGRVIRGFSVLDLRTAEVKIIEGSSPYVSVDGNFLIYVGRDVQHFAVKSLRLDGSWTESIIKRASETINSAVLSPDGQRIAFEMELAGNREVFIIDADGKNEVRLTREIQNDREPRFIQSDKLLAIKGEPRHSRAYLYDLKTLSGDRVFHNNTLRTIAPEYEWVVDKSGSTLIIVADRDGDTMSAERGLYAVKLNQKISREALLARIKSQYTAEKKLREKSLEFVKPLKSSIQSIVSQVSRMKLFGYQKTLFDFDSKYVSQPGNQKAADYIFNALESFGYRPEFQWVPNRPNKTANVLAVLKGTLSPGLFYVIGSHYDSSLRSPGADDNSSCVAVLLETARLLAEKPLPASVIFAFFTGEEAGFWGSREFVRRAKEDQLKVLAAINNDMIGWAEDFRLDNTIRYSNKGLRDLLHAAAIHFSRMVTYDTRYIKATDAVPLYEAFGDVIGGLGSYPLLANPYYHQPTDVLEKVNQELIEEAAKYNVASVMMLASSPSPVRGLQVVSKSPGVVELKWAANPENDVKSYLVSWRKEGDKTVKTKKVSSPDARINTGSIGKGQKLVVSVRAVNREGLFSWDESSLEVEY